MAEKASEVGDKPVILVRAEWSRPPWCRDDWIKVKLLSRYGYYCPVDRVQIDDAGKCWVRAEQCWELSWGGVEVRYLDYHGEGSVDSVPKKDTKPNV